MTGEASGALWFCRDDSTSFESYCVMLGNKSLGSVMVTEETPEGEPLWNWSPPPPVVLFNSGLPTPLPLEEMLVQLLSFSSREIAKTLAPMLLRDDGQGEESVHDQDRSGDHHGGASQRDV